MKFQNYNCAITQKLIYGYNSLPTKVPIEFVKKLDKLIG